MRIFLTGASGFVGSALVAELLKTPHKLTALSRSPEAQRAKIPQVEWVTSFEDMDFSQFDAVINLAGEPIFNARWTAAQKQRLTQSRVNLTEKLAEKICSATPAPKVFLSGSATGYYGDQGDNILTEQASSDKAFAAQLCQQWEQAALQAQSAKTRVCLLRTGIVLGKNGGALAKMLPLYRFGLGGKLGDGHQFWAWISLQDMVRAIVFLLENPACQGAFNLVSPNPVTNHEFNRLLAQRLNRPAFSHQPAWLLKLMLGERACLLLDSQRVVPEKLLQAGFEFSFPQLNEFLKSAI